MKSLLLLLLLAYLGNYTPAHLFVSRPEPALVDTTAKPRMVSADNEWWITNYDFRLDFSSERYTFSPDSIEHDGKWYHALWFSRLTTGPWWQPNGELWRQQGDSVFMADSDFGEVLLYDFGAAVGDTVDVGSPGYSTPVLVLAVDSVRLADNLLRRRLHLTCLDDEFFEITWIEGLGDIRLPMFVNANCAFDITSELLCYYTDGEQVYRSEWSETYGSCWITGVDEPLESLVLVHPNPTVHSLLLHGLSHSVPYELRNTTGQRVQTGHTQHNIDVQALPSGVYLLTLWVEGQARTGRIVKQ